MKDVSKRLIHAAKVGVDIDVKAILSDPMCNASSKDGAGMTALMWAAYGGHEACLEILLTRSDVSARNTYGLTALMWAARRGHETCVGLLLAKRNCDALSTSDDGMTALMHAAFDGREACVRLLLPISDALAKDNNGATASNLARNRSYERVAQFMEAYSLAESERADIGVSVCSVAPTGSAALRM